MTDCGYSTGTTTCTGRSLLGDALDDPFPYEFGLVGYSFWIPLAWAASRRLRFLRPPATCTGTMGYLSQGQHPKDISEIEKPLFFPNFAIYLKLV